MSPSVYPILFSVSVFIMCSGLCACNNDDNNNNNNNNNNIQHLYRAL